MTQPWKTVAVIGAGTQGRAFALRCVRAGFTVVLEDVLSSRLRSAAEEIESESPELAIQLTLATSVEEAVRHADVAIDFVPDELESKLEIFSMMDRMAPPRTVFCTPTTLGIRDLASCTYRAPLCAALRPFCETGEAAGAALELISAVTTSSETTERVGAWLQQLGYAVHSKQESLE